MEDLGGGLAAAFWLEAGFNVDDGTGANTSINNTAAGDKVIPGSSSAAAFNPNVSLGARQGLTFNRASTVSLLGNFGEVRLGRDYNPTFWNYTAFDPFGAVGVGSSVNVIGGYLAPLGVQAFPPGAAYPLVRTSNSIGYFSPNMSGFSIQGQLALAENPNNCSAASSTVAVNGANNNCPGTNGDGKMFGARALYGAGPLAAALGYSKTQYGQGAAAPATPVAGLVNTPAISGNLTVINYAASYQLGSLKLTYLGGTQTNDVSAFHVAKKLTHNMVSAAYAMGATTFKTSYGMGTRSDGGADLTGVANTASQDGNKVSQLAIGVQQDLSKRTAIYGTYSRLTTTANNFVATGSGLGLNAGVPANTSLTAGGLDIGIRHSF
jgi:predicted porin